MKPKYRFRSMQAEKNTNVTIRGGMLQSDTKMFADCVVQQGEFISGVLLRPDIKEDLIKLDLIRTKIAKLEIIPFVESYQNLTAEDQVVLGELKVLLEEK